jgi:hypothetical protein
MYNSGRRGKRANDGYGILSQADRFNQTEYPIPIVTSFAVTDGSYVPLDDTAVDTAGGQTIVVYGSGFAPGATIMVGGSTIGSVTYLDQGRLTFTAPANTSGSYTIIVMNANGGTGILVPGLVYSGVPTWETSAGSVGSVYETTNVSSTFVATGDAPVKYSVLSGSLPPGTSLSPTGVLSGSAPAESGSTTYSFTIRASDGQLQDSDRSFSLTVNTDVISWSTPTNNQVISAYEYAPISNVTASATSAAGYGVVYSANSVPTGIDLNSTTGVISGSVNTVGNTYTRLTATANTTLKTAIRDVVFNINQDVVTWNSPADGTQYSLTGGSPIANVTLSATSAAGFGIQYTANALPAGLSISGSDITGTPTTTETVTTLLTATANTTNRTATRTISWTISLGDLNWKNTVLLLSANTPTPSFINDSSNNNLQLTIIGDTRPINSNPYMGGYYSNLFDGTGDFLTVPDNTALQMGSGDFTIEFWIHYTSIVGYQSPFTKGYTAAGDILLQTGDGNGTLIVYLSGSPVITESTGAVVGQWYHYALVRSETTVTLYRNGVSRGTATSSVNFNTTDQAGIGATGKAPAGNSVGAFAVNGYMSNVRVVKGTAVYTSAFTPPTTPLTAIANTSLLTCQSNRLIDNSNNNFTITKNGDTRVRSAHPFVTPTTVGNTTITSLGSGYFDGTGDYLTLSTPLVPATGNFTIECWIYSLTAAGSTQRAVYSQFASAQGGRFMFGIDQTSSSRIWFHYNGADYYGTSGGIVANTWSHIALVRVVDAFDMYINGVKNTTNTFTGASLYQGAQQIAGATGASFTPNAYISDLRIVSDTALYTSNTAPPTSPLTPIANTQILTLQTNGGATNNGIVDQSSFNNIVSRFGNSTQGIFGPYSQNGWSNYFNGTSDWLSITNNSALALGSGNFTFECWVFLTGSSIPATAGVYDQRNGTNGPGVIQPVVELTSTDGYAWYVTAANRISSGSAAVKLNQWQHIAVSRVSESTRMYIDGVQVGSTYTDSNNYPAGSITIARENDGVSTRYFPGYISNLRTIAGTGLYSGTTITVPSEPLAPVANTVLLTCQDNRFIDESVNSVTLTPSGTPSVQAFSPFGGVTIVPASYSTYFDGTGDYLTTSTNAAFTYGTSDFTIEMWVFVTANPGDYAYIYSQGPNSTASVGIYLASGKFNVWNGSNVITGTTSYSLNTWYHVALTRSGTSLKLFLNGVQDGSSTNSSNITTGTTYGGTIGRWIEIGDTRHFTGYVSNLRVVKGQALYTSDFTPSTTPLTTTSQSATAANVSLLTCQSSTLVDNSTNYYTLTVSGDVKPRPFNPFGQTNTTQVSYSPSVNGGSIYFDGTGDYLTAPSSATIFGTMAYTIEFWIYRTAAPATARILENGTTATNFSMDLNTSGFFTINNNTTIAGSTSTIAVPLNAWTHVALVRTTTGASGTAWYINGVAAGTFTHSVDIAIGTTMQIARASAGSHLTGYLSDLRFTQGATLYTSSFVPPVAPLSPTTTIGNTTYTSNLLLTGTSGGVIDYHGTNNLETVGNVQLANRDPYNANGKSIYFDGTGDYLNILVTPNMTFGSSDFTVETWVYPTGVTAQQTLLYLNGNTSGYAALVLQIQSGALNLWMSSTGSAWSLQQGSIGTIVAGTWTHIAVTKSGTTMKVYINGTQAGTNYTVAQALMTTHTLNRIGVLNASTNLFTGFLKDLRITKAVRYTTAFTPPTAPLDIK